MTERPDYHQQPPAGGRGRGEARAEAVTAEGDGDAVSLVDGPLEGRLQSTPQLEAGLLIHAVKLD